MSLERRYQLLEEVCRNPNRPYHKIIDAIIRNKIRHPAERGDTSELISNFLLKSVPEIIAIIPFHRPISGMDCDHRIIFTHIRPVFTQVKTSEKQMSSFLKKIKNHEHENGHKMRIVALGIEKDFDQILQDFANQVNTIEGKLVLKAPKFSIPRPRKRKSY